MSELFLEDAHKEFISTLLIEKDISKFTIVSYNSDLQMFLEFLSRQGIKPVVGQLNKNLCKRYFQYLKFEKEYANATMRRKIYYLSSFVKFLYQEEYIPQNCMASIKAPKESKELPIYFTDEDMNKMLASTDKLGGNFVLRDKCMLLLLFLTGARRSELLNIRWKEINFTDMTINIIKGKGKKSRQVPMLPPLNVYLKALLNEKKCDAHDFVLFSNAYNQMSATTMSVIFRKYLRKNELEGKGYTLHKCRHTFATNLAKNEIDCLEIAQLLGHEDLTTTKRYVHLVTRDFSEKLKGIDMVKNINKVMDTQK